MSSGGGSGQQQVVPLVHGTHALSRVLLVAVLVAWCSVVSIEMMEHAKNYEKLLAKVSSWLKPGGKFFVHIFTHKSTPFHYVDGWMAKNFFTGGQSEWPTRRHRRLCSERDARNRLLLRVSGPLILCCVCSAQ